MKPGTVWVTLIVAIFAGASCATLQAQDLAAMSDVDACSVLLSYSSTGFERGKAVLYQTYYPGPTMRDIIGGEPTSAGIRLRLKDKRNQDVTLEYKDFSAVEIPKANPNVIQFDLKVPSKKKHISIIFEALFHVGLLRPRQDPVDNRLVQALNKFINDAQAGYPYECHSRQSSADNATELADFQQKAAAWRAMNPKPPISDEVTKKRLLAEDAVEQKNLDAAAGYYRAGVALDPTWAPGWFNGALISAELKDYSTAAFDMKHYLILMPDAPDAAAAKEKSLLWEAKAEQARGH